MSNQIVISSGAKVRNLNGVLTGTSGIVNSLGINVPDGIPQLDGSGKILVSQLPNSVMEYKGTWNAATNTPTLANGTGNAGDVYLCEVAGTVDFGAGPITFAVGDQVLYSGTIWQRASGATGTVTSVAVTESGDALTITGSPITTSGTINIGFAGTSGQYINGAGGLTTFPSLTGYVPYTGATAELDLGYNNLSASHIVLDGYSYGDGGALNFKQFSSISVLGDGYTSIGASGNNLLSFTYSQGGFNSKSFKFDVTNITTSTSRTYLMPNANGTLALTSDLGAYLPLTGGTLTGGLIGTTGSFASSGSGNTFAIDHSSGSGIALNITKAGNGEGIYVNKTSGSGNAATIIGTLNATTIVKSGGTSSQFLMADGSVNTSVLPSGAYLPLSGGTLTGALSGTSATFTSGVFNNGTNSTNGIKVVSSLSGSLFTGGIEFIRTTVVGGSKIEPFRDATSGGVGFNFLTTLNNAAEVSGTYTTALSIASTGAATFSSTLKSYGNQEIVSTTLSSTTTYLYIGTYGAGGYGTYIGGTSNYAGTSNTDLVFGTSTTSTPTERMRITSAGNTQPGTDNAYSLGVSGTRWSAVWAANGTIQTSDEREKKDIVESDLGLDFISKLRPVSFKWKVGKNEITTEIIKDEEGNPILDENGKEKTETVITAIEGKRTHYGLIAQEVEELLNGKDFGGFIHDEETDIKGLRYDQFVPLLIKSIQELQAKIVTLESKIN